MSISKAFAAGKETAAAGASWACDAFDSTGFTHIGVFTKHETSSTPATVGDNKGSGAYISLTNQQVGGGGSSWGRCHYQKIGSPGTGHIVTMTTGGTADFRSIIVWKINADSGVVELVGGANGVTASGTVSPANAGTISNPTGKSIVTMMGVAEFGSLTYTPGAGWTEDWDDAGSNSTYGGSRGPEATTSITCDATLSANDVWAACAFALAEVAAAAPTLAYVKA